MTKDYPFLGEKARRGAASVLDPLISSGAVFLVQGAVLLSVSKTEFAAFSLGYSYVVMGQTMLSALFGGPLVTLLGALRGDEERQRAGEGLLRLQVLASFAIAGMGLALALAAGVGGNCCGARGSGANRALLPRCATQRVRGATTTERGADCCAGI